MLFACVRVCIRIAFESTLYLVFQSSNWSTVVTGFPFTRIILLQNGMITLKHRPMHINNIWGATTICFHTFALSFSLCVSCLSLPFPQPSSILLFPFLPYPWLNATTDGRHHPMRENIENDSGTNKRKLARRQSGVDLERNMSDRGDLLCAFLINEGAVMYAVTD